MKFLKSITLSLFGSSRSSTPKKKKAAKKKAAKPAKKKAVKKAVKKTAKRKPVKKKTVAKKAPKAKSKKAAKKGKGKMPILVKEALSLIPVGEVTHYFPHVKAAVIKIEQGEIRQGDVLSFRGHTTKFKQTVDSMQIDHKPVAIAKEGDEIGVRVKSRVRWGDKVYKI